MLGVACTSGSGDREPARPTSSAAEAPSTTEPRVVRVRSAGCASPRAVPAGTSEHTIRSGGVQRRYLLEVPENYDGTKPYALLLGLHALTVSYRFVPSMTGFDQAGRHRFIAVAPSGRLDGTTPYWNAAPTARNYDVDFIAELLDHLEATMCVNPSRVFSTGMSNGAQMSSLLACRLSDRINAIAPVSGEEFLEPCDGTPVPILAFHGTEDPILPYTGGGLNATSIADTHYWKGNAPPGLPEPMGVDESMQRWAAHNGCDPEYDEQSVAPDVRRRTWRRCRAETVLYIHDGGGHTWPGLRVPEFESTFGRGTTEIDATALMFERFFGRSAP
jgi:polyhydroxybutyrate depolymerase